MSSQSPKIPFAVQNRANQQAESSGKKRFFTAIGWLLLILFLILSGCTSPDLPEFSVSDFSERLLNRAGSQPTVFFDISSENTDFLDSSLSESNPSVPQDRPALVQSAENSLQLAQKAEKECPGEAVCHYLAALKDSYRVLFDETLPDPITADSPEQQSAIAVYNQSLERFLCLLTPYRQQTALPHFIPDSSEEIKFPVRPNETAVIAAAGRLETIAVKQTSPQWKNEEFGSVEIASDIYSDIDSDIKNETPAMKNRSIGLPVVVKRHPLKTRPEESYLPGSLHFPMTVIFRPEPVPMLEFIDPFTQSAVAVQGRALPLAANPGAAVLRTFDKKKSEQIASTGLMQPEMFFLPLSAQTDSAQTNFNSRKLEGLYLIQPYSPKKIPVILIHGLWSSPGTWREMVQRLLAVPAIREHFQFWFYAYPTGLPWWFSAANLRQDLVKIREKLDPNHQNPAMDEMVLIGHSMGGLIARLQVAKSGNTVWELNSDVPPEILFSHPQKKITDAFFFEPNLSIQRVITIATPYRGSRSATTLRQHLAEHLIEAPLFSAHKSAVLADADPDHLKHPNLLTVQNSVEALSPENPFFSILETLPIPDSVVINNMIGYQVSNSLFDRSESDGVVERTSTEIADAETELTVEASHMEVHRNPVIIEKTASLLIDHLYQMNSRADSSTGQ